MKIRLLCACLTWAAADAGAQMGVLDQVSPFGASFFSVSSSGTVWQQQVKAGVSGTLEGVKILSTQGQVGSLTNVRIRKGPAWSTSPVLVLETVVRTVAQGNQTHFVDVSGAGISLSAGELFVIEFVGDNFGGMVIAGSSSTIPWYPEPLFKNGVPNPSPGARIGFETYVLVAECYPDCNADDVLDVQDFGCFANLFISNDPYADCNGDSVFDVQDFGCFVNEFISGCP